MFAYYLQHGLIKGYGTYQIKNRIIIEQAVENGYNFFDTAQLYKNEDLVISVIRSHPNKKLFVSTKISYIDIENGQIEKSFKERLEKFGNIKINLLLLHKPSSDCRRDWKTLCKLYSEHRDKIDYIGVSNYDIKHLDQIKELPIPFINQIELSPFNIRHLLVEYCKTNGIMIVSHTTLTRKIMLNSPLLVFIANKYKISPVNLLLKWANQNNYITIPRTSRLDHLIENIQELYIEISTEDMKILNEDLNESFFLTKVLF